MAHHALSSPQFQSSLSLIVLSLFMSHGTLQNCIVAKLWIVRARCFYFISAAVYNWFSVFHACRFYHSAKPFLFRSQFLVSSSPEPADPDESLSVCWPKDHVFFFILTTASVNLLFANGHLTLSSSFFSLKSHYFSSSFPTFQWKSREFSSILSLLAFR